MKIQKEKKGFSIIEMIISIFIFSIVIVMLTGAFSGFLKKYTDQKKVQKNIENIQYAMNIMSKTIRTSSIDESNPTSFPLRIYDFSQGECIEYNYSSHKITTKSFVATDMDQCTAAAFGAAASADLTTAIIQGASIKKEASNSTSDYGKVTIAVTAVDANMPIQMTVSLRQ